MFTRGLLVCLVGCGLTLGSVVDGQTKPIVDDQPGPPWLALGRDGHRANDRQAAEGKVLEFLPQARWFQAFPKPVTKAEYDAWVKSQGARVQLQSLEEPRE